jgi:uncharacterized membrane protein YgcG
MRAITDLRALLNLYRRKFPQSLFSVFVMGRVDNGTIAEFTFWLGNRARFSGVGAVGENNFDVLLGLDLHARAAALQIGYGLENYLTERDLERALARAAKAFSANDLPRAIRECIEFMMERMREVARAAAQAESPETAMPIANAE